MATFFNCILGGYSRYSTLFFNFENKIGKTSGKNMRMRRTIYTHCNRVLIFQCTEKSANLYGSNFVVN